MEKPSAPGNRSSKITGSAAAIPTGEVTVVTRREEGELQAAKDPEVRPGHIFPVVINAVVNKKL